MNINNVNSISTPPNISYEFYTIHVDSNTYTGGYGNNFTTYLFNPLKDVVQVSILNAVFACDNYVPVAYLTVDELQSQFNEITGNVETSDKLAVTAYPFKMAQLQNPLAAFPLQPFAGGSSKQVYRQGDFSTQTQFINPIRRLDRLTCKLWDTNGEYLQLSALQVHISFRFTCLRSNLGPNKKK